MSGRTKHIKALDMRRDFLHGKLENLKENGRPEHGYLEAESRALHWAIPLLTAYVDATADNSQEALAWLKLWRAKDKVQP